MLNAINDRILHMKVWHLCVCMPVYACVYICVFVCVFSCVCVYVGVCVYACACVCTDADFYSEISSNPLGLVNLTNFIVF